MEESTTYLDILFAEPSRVVSDEDFFDACSSGLETLLARVEVIRAGGKVTVRGPYSEMKPLIEKLERRAKEKRRQSARDERLAKVGGTYKREELAAIWEIQEGRCYYSNEVLGPSFERAKLEVDHIIPLQLAGTNWPSNLALVTRKMNSWKGSYDRSDFMTATFPEAERAVLYKRIHRIDRERRKLFRQPDFCEEALEDDSLFGPCVYQPSKPRKRYDGC